MTTADVTEAVVEIARSFATLVKGIEPDFAKAYLRLRYDSRNAEAKASYVRNDGTAEIVDVLQHKAFFHAMARSGPDLLFRMGKAKGIFVLLLASDFSYEIRFEYDNMERWSISKLSGGTGIPNGLESDDA
jgi:hypothetical protein